MYLALKAPAAALACVAALFRMLYLLRYERFYNLDLWPKGQMEGFVDKDWVQFYGTSKCWPVGLSEKVS